MTDKEILKRYSNYKTPDEFELYRGAYSRFMHNPENRCKCDECPENKRFGGSNPCGQQNCWVDIHCQDDEDAEDLIDVLDNEGL